MNTAQRACALLVLGLATACSAAVPTSPRLPADAFHEASIRTAIEVSSGALVFRFAACGTGGHTIVRSASIYDIQSSGLVCALRKTDYSQPTLEGPWRYGSAVPGYAMEGCAPLEPGKYQIQENGAGLGALDFEITTRRRVRVFGESCAGTLPRLR